METSRHRSLKGKCEYFSPGLYQGDQTWPIYLQSANQVLWTDMLCVWCSAQDRKALQRVIRPSQSISEPEGTADEASAEAVDQANVNHGRLYHSPSKVNRTTTKSSFPCSVGRVTLKMYSDTVTNYQL